MRPSAILGALAAIIVSLVAISWLTSSAPGSNRLATTATTAEQKAPDPAHPDDHDHGKDGHAKDADPADPHAAATTDGTGKPETHQTNPFKLDEPGPKPSAELAQPFYDFGEMVLGETGTHEFVIHNSGAGPLRVAKGRSTCKCTIPSMDGGEIGPGKDITVTLNWTPVAMDRQFRQEAVIWTNDPQNPQLTLTINGAVMPEVYLAPEGSLSLGDVNQGEPKTVVGQVFSRKSKELTVEPVDTAEEVLSVEIVPSSPEDLKTWDAVMGYDIKVTARPSDEVGVIREAIRFKTNIATSPEFSWRVTGSRPGPIKIVGPGWYAAQQVFTLGQFKASDGFSRRLSLFTAKSDEPMKVTEIKTDGPVKLTIEPDPKFQNAERDKYFLTVEFPKGGTPGRYMLEQPLPVTVHTTHPKVPVMKLNVSYEAL